MKIEKISDKRLKILLTSEDLKQRNIKMTELAFGTEKTRELFKEMMEIASDECDFYAEDSQLMIEAIPLSLEAIVILVTKIDEEDTETDKIPVDSDSDSDSEGQERSGRRFVRHAGKSSSVKKSADDNLISVFEFNKLDDVSLVSRSLFGRFTGESYLLKLKGNYFLVLQNNSSLDEISDKDLEIIMGEYGRKREVNPISRAYLFEHGELIIDNPAIDVLSEYL
jgi:adapter protein MecA 1/2